MENLVARILLKNLVGRIEQRADGSFVLDGKLTQEEIEALNFALRLLEATPTTSVPATPAEPAPLPPIPPSGIPGNEAEAQDVPKSVPVDEVVSVSPPIDIDTSSLQLPAAPNDIRLCLDFGTAMSKATLVRDGEDDYDDEQITVLRLGVYGDDEEDEYMLISSVYIDNGGKLWFGKDAEEISARESDDGSRQRMDNIKRWLSEGMIDSPVGERFNPTRIRITYADVLLAYLTFLTWTVNKALEDADQPPGGYPRNLNRRFAMPCLSGATFREVSHRLILLRHI